VESSAQNESQRTQHLAAGLLCFCGALLRFVPLMFINPKLPHDLGGLFLEFSLQIAEGGLRLPHRISFYSGGGIPFAYPPLPFYFEAFVLHLLPVSEIAVGNVLPLLIGSASLPLFWWLTGQLRLPSTVRMTALLVYALTPSVFLDQISSAGLAESFGSVAVILLAIALLHAVRKETIAAGLIAGVAWAFCILSSPGSAYASVLIVAIFSWDKLLRGSYCKIKGRALISAITMGGTALALSAPYWLTVLLRHGSRVFSMSFGAQHGSISTLALSTIVKYLDFDVALGPVGFLTDALILAGLIWSLCRKRHLVVAWFLVTLAVPREGRWLVSAPAAILGGTGIVEFLNLLHRCRGRAGRLGGFALATTSLLLNAGGALLMQTADYDEDTWIEAMGAATWVMENTSESTELLVLSNEVVREWVPHLSRRTILNVEFGQEWEPDDLEVVEAINSEVVDCTDGECVCDLAARVSDRREYLLYVQKDLFPSVSSCTVHSGDFKCLWSNERFLLARLDCAGE